MKAFSLFMSENYARASSSSIMEAFDKYICFAVLQSNTILYRLPADSQMSFIQKQN